MPRWTWTLLSVVGDRGCAAADLRKRILDLVERTPGITIRELSRKADTSWPNARFHVRALERAGVVASRSLGRRRVCYVVPFDHEALLKARVLLQEATARAIARFIVDHEGASLNDVITGTPCSERAAYHHLRRLLHAKLLTHSNDARYKGLRPTALLLEAIKDME